MFRLITNDHIGPSHPFESIEKLMFEFVRAITARDDKPFSLIQSRTCS